MDQDDIAVAAATTPATEEGTNGEKNQISPSLHRMIEDADWKGLEALFDSLTRNNKKNGHLLKSKIVSKPFPYHLRNGDFPLHAILDYNFDIESNMKDSNGDRCVGPGLNRSATVQDGGGEGRGESRQDEVEVVFKKEEPPPISLVLDIIHAFPEATKVKGARGCLPLHNASRRGAPRSIVETLIRLFPQALDIQNDDGITPRDYIQSDLESNALINRPVCCWLQQLSNEETHLSMDEELQSLEREVSGLQKTLAQSLHEEDLLFKEFEQVEKKMNRLNIFNNDLSVVDQVDLVTLELQHEIDDVSNKILESLQKLEVKEEQDYKNHEYLRAFHEDVKNVYSLDELNSLREEVDKIQKKRLLKAGTSRDC